MSEENKGSETIAEAGLASHDETQVKALRAKLDRELLALLAHPLVPQAFKDVFQERK